ncbi:GDYXXLXY domain-containing protein [Candidatus Ruminimicrobiellum ovillum]|uniref:GDYXXLXY domain-containing protein n=1 Tax=Candidatus Ruminimicrobiellum ovillum TaxID=1947927 RepID=UPI00355A8AA9
MRNKFLLFMLLIPVICLFVWNCFLWYDKDSGTEITVRISGYDPRDLLSGHYIRYTIDWDKTDLQQFEDKSFTKDDFVDSLNKNSYRFYVSETHAKYLDKLLMESWNIKEENNKKIEVVYSYKQGKHPIAKKLLVDGEPYQKII